MVLPPITKILYAHLSILFVQQESKIVPDVTGLVTSRVADPDSEKNPDLILKKKRIRIRPEQDKVFSSFS